MCRPPEEAGKDPDVWRDRAGPGWAATNQASREEGVTGGASSKEGAVPAGGRPGD